MPSSETTLPHVAFTHHQIGVHPRDPGAVAPENVERLVPLFDIETLSEDDRKRSLGLAWEILAVRDGRDGMNAQGREATQRAEELLTALPAEFVDVWVLAALTELYYLRKDLPRAAETGLKVLRKESGGPRAKIQVLLPLGIAAASEGRFSEAANYFSELAGLRRHADDWYFLGRCEHKLGRDDAAIRALTTALQLDLSHIPARTLLAEIYRSQGDFDAEQRLRDELARLSRNAQRPP
jgi:tetratricopeptide (TPR) repeat protein